MDMSRLPCFSGDAIPTHPLYPSPIPNPKKTKPKTGCTAWVTNRIPDPVKAQLRANRSLEFLWATESGEGESADGAGAGGMLTHVLDTHYESPAGTCGVVCVCLCVYSVE